MSNQTSERLRRNIEKIMRRWIERDCKEIPSAADQELLVLRNSIPKFLGQIADALSTVIDRTKARAIWDLKQSDRVEKEHGHTRAESQGYTIDQLIFEYHLLRRVICDVMEEEAPLNSIEMEIITCAIEQGVNVAATEFTDTLNEIKERLGEAVAHDLRNPITAAKIGAGMLLRKPDDANFVIKTAAQIDKNLTKANTMTQDFLDVSRLKAGEEISLNLKECDLEKIVRLVVSEFSNLHKRPFIFKSDGPILGFWSEKELRRIVENLLTNAIKYSTPDAPITVTVSQTSDVAKLIVRNEGKPISKEDQELIFQPHQRGESAEKHLGWGIGLTVVKEMTERFQGKVSVESSEKEGTSFIVKLSKKLDKNI